MLIYTCFLNHINVSTLQPTIAAIDFLRNFKRLYKFLLPKTVILRLVFLTLFTAFILALRLWIQDFEAPLFRPEDNAIAAAESLTTRILSQNYLYCLNFYLLLNPEWLSFDWSFNSIALINDFNDWRVAFLVIFYLILMSMIFIGLKRK